MPRKAKDEINTELNEDKKATTPKKSAAKSNTTKSTATKRSTSKTTTKSVASKNSAAKATKATKSTKSTKATKSPSAKGTTKNTKTTKSSKNSKTTKSKIVEVLEYYDLPYRYNQTVVKILAQTPNTLFVYWDISDEDKEKYIEQYGEYFFNDTKPVLVVHNNTKNTSFEVEINDFANSWYLHLIDSDCDYTVELGRRPINNYAQIHDYLPMSSSNDIESPNDHILFDRLNNNVYFRNVKTNVETKKDISLSFLTKIGKIYNVQEFYENLYKDEVFDFNKLNLRNMPSS